MVIESPDDVIFIGGTPYGIKVHKNEAMKDVKHAIEEENKKLRNDIESTIWFSYRSGWKRYLPGTKLDGDVGWGCMIRCGQMMIAKAAQKSANDRSDHLNKQLIDLCNDEGSSELSPFSLFGLVDYASQTFSVQPGQWFRATTIMMSLEHMNKVHNPPLTNHIAIHTSVDSVVEPKELFFRALPSRAAEKNDDPKYYIQALSTSTWEKELLLCVAVRTGLNKPQANFKDCLAELISLPQAVGFLGGRDSKAYFVIGMLILTQGYNKRKEKYYYLDPHYVQDADNKAARLFDSYHTKTLYEYSYEDMVTSLMLCFLLRSKEDFNNLYEKVEKMGEENVPFNFNKEVAFPFEANFLDS